MPTRTDQTVDYDILIIGGGINGAGIARDAAGRGFKVCLCEVGDIGGCTSSASTKLLHGGLRYLEYFQFRLVREALAERETLLHAMPHISRPMRFVLPYHPGMRFETDTPTSRLLSILMPWKKGQRPIWLIRIGLFIYDCLASRRHLPGTRILSLVTDEAGNALKPKFETAFEYSDCWVDDSRLVILNLRDAERHGASVNVRCCVCGSEFRDGVWHTRTYSADTGERTITSAMIVNATGPWVDSVLASVFKVRGARNIRLVRGSHIVVNKKFDHERAYLFQNDDGRIIFAIPYECDFALIGTTDAEHCSIADRPEMSNAERDYLCEKASAYFREAVTPSDIVWSYSGVRPLYDDDTPSAQAATRDYVIERQDGIGDGSLINIFGGKITTYRKLSESVVRLIEESLGVRGAPWTLDAPLPGGNFPIADISARIDRFMQAYPFLEDSVARRLVRSYGTEADKVIGGRRTLKEMGRHFGFGLYEAELTWLMEREWARNAEDVLFRRTRIGIRMDRAQIDALDSWMDRKRSEKSPDLEEHQRTPPAIENRSS